MESHVKLVDEDVLVTRALLWAKAGANNQLVCRHLDGTETRYHYDSRAEVMAALARVEAALDDSPVTTDIMNAPIFDDTNASPGGLVPTDPSKSCLWFGAGGTFYVWNPVSGAWEGKITE